LETKEEVQIHQRPGAKNEPSFIPQEQVRKREELVASGGVGDIRGLEGEGFFQELGEKKEGIKGESSTRQGEAIAETFLFH